MTDAADPDARVPTSPWPRWRARWALLRPGFLGVSASAALVGLAMPVPSQPLLALKALAVLVLLALAHAAINAWNDVEDARSGADAANHGRLAPFCGGSRALQEGGMALRDARRLVALLGLLTVSGGVLLTALSTLSLLWVGMLGALLGWAYSAPPLALMRRGWGEPAVALAWALIPIGAHLAIGGSLSGDLLSLAVFPALGACAILVIANLADREADAAHGKRTLVVRLGATRTVAVFSLLHGLLWLWLITCASLGAWPAWTLLALAGALPGLRAVRLGVASLGDREVLRLAIPAAIQASLLGNLGLAAGWLIAGLRGGSPALTP